LSGRAAGRVGKPHGRDGSFYVDEPSDPLGGRSRVTIAGVEREIERRAGTDERPLIRVSGVGDRDAAGALRGEPLLVDEPDTPLETDEWLVSDLVGCRIDGLGYVERVLDGPSCDVLEVGPDGVLVPFVSDAVKRVDIESREIEIDRAFLGV